MDSLMDTLAACKNDPAHPERSVLIEKYRPFIKSCLSKETGSFVDDEAELVGLGMEAFNEAISRYDKDQGSFLHFAALIIRSRAIDHLRKEGRQELTQELKEEDLISPSAQATDLSLEVGEFIDRLASFSIDIEVLVEASPKHKRVRRRLIDLSAQMVGDKALMEKMEAKKKLPMAHISRTYAISKKRLKQHRDFIMALLIIRGSGLSLVEDFLKGDDDNA